MASGFQVFGDALNAQITSDTKNLMLQTYSDISSIETSPSSVIIEHDVAALQPTVAGLSISTDYYHSGRGRQAVNGTGRVYQFGTYATKGSSGLEVYNSDGSVAYTSSKPLMKVIDSGSVSLNSTFRKKYNKPVAIVFSSSLHAIYPSGGYTGLVIMSGVSIDSSGYIVVGQHKVDVISQYPGNTPDIGVSQSDFLVLDASNLLQ